MSGQLLRGIHFVTSFALWEPPWHHTNLVVEHHWGVAPLLTLLICTYIQDLPLNQLLLKLDFKNTLNTLRGGKMLMAMRESAPDL